MAIFAVSNFLGPLLLGRLFDTVGRIPMISGTYLGSAAVVTVLGILLLNGSLTTWSFMALVLAAFFLASAGASSAYLTVSEVFPMETRALAIALFFAVGTAAGGITGPALFGNFIHSGDVDLVATGFFIGAGAMALGGIAELFLGVRAEQQSLENIATPLTAEEAEAPEPPPIELSEEEQRREERVRDRNARHSERHTSGLRRYRPGPPARRSSFYSPGMMGTSGTLSRSGAMADLDRDREIEAVCQAVDGNGGVSRGELERRCGGHAWGPGRFTGALRDAIDEGRVTRLPSGQYVPSGTRDSATD
jgi:MFS family permease